MKYLIALALLASINAEASTRVLHCLFSNVDLTDKINNEIRILEKRKHEIKNVSLQEVIINCDDGYIFDYASVLITYKVKHKKGDICLEQSKQ